MMEGLTGQLLVESGATRQAIEAGQEEIKNEAEATREATRDAVAVAEEKMSQNLDLQAEQLHHRFDDLEKVLDLVVSIQASSSGGSAAPEGVAEIDRSALQVDNDNPANLLGRGTHGVVVRGHLVHGGKSVSVAVKKVDLQDQQAAKSVMKEIGALTKLRHANIVHLLGACREAGPHTSPSMLVVLEFCPLGGLDRVLGIFKGDQLSERVQEWATRCLDTLGGNSMRLEGVPAVREARSRLSIRLGGPLGAGPNKAFFFFFSRVMEAFQYIHSQNQIHRDVKPENILIDARGRPKISDFGLTIAFGTMALPTLGDGGGGGGGAGVGTPGYMAPEVLKRGEHSIKGDIFSLAVLMAEALTGTRAFSDKHGNPYTINMAVASGERPPLPPDLPPALHDLLPKMWHEAPKKRPRALAVAAALEEAQAEMEEGEQDGDSSAAAQRRRQSGVGRKVVEGFPQELVDMLTPVELTEEAMGAVLHHLCNEWGATRAKDLDDLEDEELEEVAKLVPRLKKKGLKNLLKQTTSLGSTQPWSESSGGTSLPKPPPTPPPSPPVATLAETEKLGRAKEEAAAKKAAEEKTAAAKQAEAERQARAKEEAAEKKAAEERAVAAAKQAEAERMARAKAQAAERAAEEKPAAAEQADAAIERVVQASGKGRLNWSAKEDMSTWSRVTANQQGLLEVDLDRERCGFQFSKGGGSLLQDIALLFGGRLRKLDLHGQTTISGSFEVFTSLLALQELDVSYTKVDCSRALELISSAPWAPHIKKLGLKGSSLNVQGDIAALGSCTNLVTANFNECRNITGDIAALGNCANLKEAYFLGCWKLTGDIAALGKCTNLKTVNFSGSWLSPMQITGDIAALGNCTNLKSADFQYCRKITGDIAALGSCTNLVTANFRSTNITGDKEAIKRALPNCKFSF